MSETIEIPGVPTLATEGIAELPPLEAPGLEPEPGTTAPPAGGEPPKRRRRRRTSKAPEPTPEPAGPSSEDVGRLAVALGAGFAVAGSIMAAARGAHWQLTPEEQETLGQVWAPALAPYMGGAGRYMPFVLATLTTVGVFLPRVQQDRAGVQNAPVPTSALPVESFTVPGKETAATATPEGMAPVPGVGGASESPIPIDPPAGRRRTGGARP